jgi:hypothetical protein
MQRSEKTLNVTNVGGALGASMSPLYAACAQHRIDASVDLVLVEFAVNDPYPRSRMPPNSCVTVPV